MRDMCILSLSSFFRWTQDSEEKSEEDSRDQIPHHVDDPVTVDDAATCNDKEIEDIPRCICKSFVRRRRANKEN
jgi:hypothetical protein